MADSELDHFLEGSYQGESAESLEFSVDTERGKEVLRHALRDAPDYFLTDLLAVANLSGSAEFLVTSHTPRAVLARAVFGPKLTLVVEIAGRACSESELRALPDQMYQTQDRLLFRLSLALNRLSLLKSANFILESWDGQSRHSYELKGGKTRCLSQPAPQSRNFEGLRVKVWDFYFDDYMKQHLRHKSAHSSPRLVLNGVEIRGFSTQEFLWSKAWQNQRIPLGKCQNVEQSPGDYSLMACLSSGILEQGMGLVPVLDGVQLEELKLWEDDYPESFVPGLTLFVRRDSWRLDASHRRLVVGESLKSDVKEYLALIRPSLVELSHDDRAVVKQYLLASSRKPTFKSLMDGLRVVLKGGDSLLCKDLSGAEALFLRRRVAEKDQMVLEQFLSETLPYQFCQGYNLADDSLISINGHWFANFSPWQVMVYSLQDKTSRLVLTYLRPTVEKVVFHPSRPWIAILTKQDVRVWDLEVGQETCRLVIDAIDLDFSTCDTWLYLIQELGTKSWLRRLHLSGGELETGSTEVPSGEFSVVGEFALFVGDDVTVYELPEPGQPLYKFSFPFDSAVLEDVSADGRRVLLRNSAGWDYALLDLEKMTHSLLTTRSLAFRFSWCGDYLLGQGVHDFSRVIQRSFRAKIVRVSDQTESRLKIGKAGMGMRLRTGRVFEANSSLYPAPRKAVFQLNEVPLLGPSVETLTPPQRVPAGAVEALLGYRDTSRQGKVAQLNLWSDDGWEPIWDGLTPECSLTPERFLWESPQAVFSLDRQSGKLGNHSGARLFESALLRHEGKAVYLLHPRTGENGPRVFKPSQVMVQEYSLPQCYSRYLTMSPGAKSHVVDVEEARVLSRVTSFNLMQSNGEWLLRTVLDLSLKAVQYFKRPGPLKRWRRAPVSGLLLHPTDAKAFYPTKTGVGIFDLASPRGRYEASCDKTSVSISPGGQFVLRQSTEQSTSSIMDARSLELLGRVPGGATWLSESVLWAQGHLWVTDPELGWRRPQLTQCLEELAFLWDDRCGVIADGATETFVYRRAGQFDIWDARSGTIKAILHPLGEEWFVFRIDGTWDCSPGALPFVVGAPDPKDRQPGLLWEALRV